MKAKVVVCMGTVWIGHNHSSYVDIPTGLTAQRLLRVKPGKKTRTKQALALPSPNKEKKGVELYYTAEEKMHMVRLSNADLKRLAHKEAVLSIVR